MKFTVCPWSSSFSISCFPVEEARDFCCSAASSLISKLLYAIFIFIFAVVGATLGAITGALLGAKTKTGLMHGVAVGSIKGSFLSFKLLEISLIICRSNDLALATKYGHLLQPDFLAWEAIHRWPQCHHMFHVSCLQKWVRRHTSCPLCGRNFLTAS